MTMKDFLGQDIAVGDTIVYPGRSGSTLFMNRGIVESILPTGNLRVKKTTTKWGEPTTKVVTLWGTARVVVISDPPRKCRIPCIYCGTK